MFRQWRWMAAALAVAGALVGVYFVVRSPVLAERAMFAVMSRRGGGMDTSTYLVMFEAYTRSYQLLGGVLLGVGLFRALDPGAGR